MDEKIEEKEKIEEFLTCIKKIEDRMSETLGNFLSYGYVKNIANIYSYLNQLNSDKAKSCMESFPESMLGKIQHILPKVDVESPETLSDVAHILESSALSLPETIEEAHDAAIELNESKCDEILSELKKTNPLLSTVLDDVLFMFKDLVLLHDNGIQMLLQEFGNDTWRYALVDADEAVVEKVLKNMTKRAAKMMREDIACAKVWSEGKMNKVYECRTKICQSVRDHFGWSFSEIPEKPYVY